MTDNFFRVETGGGLLRLLKQHANTVIVLLAAGLTCILVFDADSRAFGDSDVFISLGEALASGEGYVNTWRPEKPPADHFPIGYPLIIALVRLASDSILPLKLLSAGFFVATAMLAFLVFQQLGVGRTMSALAAVVMAACGNLVVYATAVMSEMPFMFFSLLAILAFVLVDFDKKPQRDSFVWLLAVALLSSFYIRTIGIALIGAVIATLIIRRAWPHVIFIATVGLAVTLPTLLLKGEADGGYVKYFLMANQNDLSQGSVGVQEVVSRIASNLRLYLRFTALEMLIPTMRGVRHNIVFSYGVSAAILGLAAFGIWRLPRHRLIVVLYIAAIFAILLVWPPIFSSDRLLLPVLPALVVGLIHGTHHARNDLVAALLLAIIFGLGLTYLDWGGRLYALQNKVTWLLSLAVFAVAWALLVPHRNSLRRVPMPIVVAALVICANVPELVRLSEKSRGPQDKRTLALTEVGTWAKENTDARAVFASPDHYYVHRISGRPSWPHFFDRDAFGEDVQRPSDMSPETAVEYLKERGISYVVIDNRSERAERYLRPVLDAAPQRFSPVFLTPDSLFTVYAVN